MAHTMITPGQKLAKLRQLMGEAGRNVYDRVALVSELLSDKEWVRAEHAGDVYAAAEFLEADFFHDLCGTITLWNLLHVFQKFPKVKEWEAQGFNLKTLYGLCKPPTEKKGKRTVIHQSEYRELQEKAESLAKDVKLYQKQAKMQEKTIEELRQEVEMHQEENLRLKGRIEELERILDKKLNIKVSAN